MVWIGRKRHSREKINVPHNLEWGIHQFRLLGFHFCTNLDEMPMLNYSASLKQYNKLLMGWKKRNLNVVSSTNSQGQVKGQIVYDV